jgi:hypothetical protein
MIDQISADRADRALDLSIKIAKDLEMDGEDYITIFAIFAIGSSIVCQVNNVEKENYLKHCEMFYDETTRFLKDTGISEGEDE